MKKKRGWLVLCLIFLLVLAGCQKEATTEAVAGTLPVEPEEMRTELIAFSAFLGYSDEELVAQRGEGTVNYQDIEDITAVGARVYEEEIFAVPGEAIFVFGDDQTVNSILLTLTDIGAEDLLGEINEALDEPDLLLDEDGVFHAEWQKEGILYSLDDDGTTVAIAISLILVEEN